MATYTETMRRVHGRELSWPLDLGARVLLANLLLVLASKIAFPLPWTPVPLTLQTLGVLLIAIFFGPRISAVAAGLYLVEGAAGLPVFQPFGAPGAARLFGPTAGFLLAFPMAAYGTGRLLEFAGSGKGVRQWMANVAAMVPGEALILFCGWAWLSVLVGVQSAWVHGVAPFLAGECAKVGAAAAIACGLGRED
ncbi:MAG TPA: biotin transporter BioY [Candidatus Binatia bacterium]|nr:biotin transporter BioY [Candidatus Binatia bacterium]